MSVGIEILGQIDEKLGRIAHCLEIFVENQEAAKNQNMTVVMKDAMDAFYEANPAIAAVMKQLQGQMLERGNQNVISSS